MSSRPPILDVLRCPACAARPDPDAGRLSGIGDSWLVCSDCERKYPIRNHIPVLLIAEGDRHRHTPPDRLGEP